MLKQRIHYVDIIKGIGIILMVITHCMSGSSWFGTWVFAFHMPLFVILSGFLFYRKYSAQNEFRSAFGGYVRKKSYQILIPYIVFSLLIIIWQIFLSLISQGTTGDIIRDGLTRIISLRGMESLWFLPCLLLAELMFATVFAFCRKKNVSAVILCVIFVILNILMNGKLSTNMIGVFVKSTMCYVFFMAGYYFSEVHHRLVNRKYSRVVGGSMMIVAVPLSLLNGFSAIGNFTFGNVPLYYVSACLTVFGLVLLLYNVECPYVEYWGKNSIVVLCTNNLVIEVLRLLDYKLFDNWCIYNGIIGDLVFAMCVLAIEIPVIQIGMKYFGVLFGKSKSK